MTDQRQELEDIKAEIRGNKEVLKPVFGYMFWQLSEAERALSPEEFANEGMNLTLESSDDEVIASFMANYIKLWLSAKDFNAASRFVADCLELTADELLQSRQVFLDSLDEKKTPQS